MESIEDKLKNKLESRVKSNNYRSLKLAENLIDFTSNDYLGLARSEALLEQIRLSEVKERLSGATGSRLLSGNSSLCQETEQFLAQIFLAEKALIFNSGYSANLSILSAVPQKGDTILYDELIHASLKDGARLSMAQHLSFRHNDMIHFEKKLKIAKGNVFVVVESIYSMDGDACPLQELVMICEKYGAVIILDEAHSTGIMGHNGNGLACTMEIQDKIFARIYTFGKAMGMHGACIAGSSILIDFLINFSRPFIYTTALPPHSIHAIKHAFVYLEKNLGLQELLKRKIVLFIKLMEEAGIKGLNPSESAIQALVFSHSQQETVHPDNFDDSVSERQKDEMIRMKDQKSQIKDLAATVQKRGFDVRPILSPTVKEGSERIRICLHVHNSDSEIENLVIALKNGMEEHIFQS